MDRIPPVPKPRGNHLEQKHSKCKMPIHISKRPVPLPRRKIVNEPSCRPREMNTEDSVLNERQKCSITSHVSENSDRTQCNKRIPSQDLKEEWEIVCDDVQPKGKSVIGKTKNVSASIEKSVRNMIGRRLTVRATAQNKVNDISVIKTGRSQSLPSGDIFQSISFHSPLAMENAPQELVASEHRVEEDCVSTPGAPPPVYPPPPLPDESVYDEVHSVVSSHSSSYEPYCDSNIANSETLYEDISLFRESSGLMLPDPSRKTVERNVLDGIETPFGSKHKFPLRSDSWSFYDTAPEDIYQNVAPSDVSSFNDSDSMIYNRHCSSKLSGTESTASSSLTGDLNCDNSDEISEGEPCTNSSIHLGRQQSVNVRNDLYENWETSIPVRRVEESRKVPTKSVILEFDPLYANADGSGKADDSYTEYLLLSGTCGKDSSYGKINRVGTLEVPEHKRGENGEFVCPPVPPRRYDSITVMPTEESSSSVEPANEYVSKVVPLSDCGVNSQKSSPEKLESGFAGDDDVSVDGVVGRNRKAALVRWASMKRAIQLMTEGSSFKKMTKEQVGTDAKSGTQNTLFYGGQDEASTLIKRPNWTSHAAIQHSGLLYRSASGSKDFVPRRCILAEGKLSYFSDKSGTSISEVIPLDKLLSIQFVLEHKPG
jgi:hypothetical protein